MQTNKLSSYRDISSYSNSRYHSSYNTQVVAAQSRAEMAGGKQTQQSRSVEQASSDRSCAGQVGNASFDFAGLAG